ncbi:hypothetical protein BV898_14969 [Hypsibius exemplaris]|uniref:Uncharacterized protein n=1 Tax=Hypsibius exemplaris TaxID=2072580 RepID=A0A9X6NAI8_HYPEX|nr:hypothetical protein BV898_14969 [Hypsibius exemplaris]
MLCLAPISEYALFIRETYATHHAQREAGDNSPMPVTEKTMKKMCMKIQEAIGCFANYFRTCLNMDLPYLNKVSDGLLLATKVCDQANLYENIQIMLSCHFAGPDLEACGERLQILNEALTKLSEVNKFWIPTLMMGNMRGLQRIICCLSKEVGDCYEAVFTTKCSADFLRLWSDIKESHKEIFSCDVDTMKTCPAVFLEELKKLTEKTQKTKRNAPKTETSAEIRYNRRTEL